MVVKMMSTVLHLSSLVALFCISLAHPTQDIESSNKLYADLLVEMKSQQHIAAGTCADAGHTSGCCVAGLTGCRVDTSNGPCYCDRICHLFRDCCSDITSIECLPQTCGQAHLSRGCCRWSPGHSCFVPGGSCYCDRLCIIFNDCCPDTRITACLGFPPTTPTTPVPTTAPTTPAPTTAAPTTPVPTTVAPTTPVPTIAPTTLAPVSSGPSCLADHLPGSGCCNDNACRVDGGADGTCYCDLLCHAEKNCCHDIQQLNCLPNSCTEAGKLGCVVNTASDPPELCNVTTPQGITCFCDENCNASGNTHDCCDASAPPAQLSANDLLRISQWMRMKQLAQQMSLYRSRVDSPGRRYQAGRMAHMQDRGREMDRPRQAGLVPHAQDGGMDSPRQRYLAGLVPHVQDGGMDSSRQRYLAGLVPHVQDGGMDSSRQRYLAGLMPRMQQTERPQEFNPRPYYYGGKK